MIHVNIEVPVLGTSYYFQIEEMTTVREATALALSQIAEAEKMSALHPDAFRMAGGSGGRLLSPEATFAEYEIGSGSTLTLL